MAAAAHLRRLRESLEPPVTLGSLAGRLGRDGAGLLAVLIAVPFLQPVPLAGLGTPFGLLLAAAGLQLMRGAEALSLPGFVARRPLEARVVERVLGAAEKVLGVLERWTRRRWGAAHSPRLLGLGLVLTGAMFAVPVFVPLGNPVTAAATILLGLALLEEDGLLGLLGLLGAGASLALHAAFLALLWKGGRAVL